MSERGKELFNQLQSAQAILALIGQPEDAHLDCKEWPNDRDAQSSLAKAACGLTNAEGGVLIVGMKARPTSKEDPDLIESAAPVADTAAVKSRILDLVGQLVEPGIEGIQAAEVSEQADSRSGFVVVHVPASDGPPRRSKKDWKFYLRIGSGTFPMEYFQIEERFGKRPPPRLELYLKPEGISPFAPYDPNPCRWFELGLQNSGSGIAKFPSIRFKPPSKLNVDLRRPLGLPRHRSENEWEAFRGGADDVIYPEEILKIAKLVQPGAPIAWDSSGQARTQWTFAAVTFQCEISCEGAPTKKVEQVIPEESTPLPLAAG
jgi:hypothetical protein